MASLNDLSSALESVKLGKSEEICRGLDSILNIMDRQDVSREDVSQLLLDNGVLPEIKNQLQKSSGERGKLAKIVAELAKTEQARQPCLDCGLVPDLVNILSSGQITESTEACRALGNICFDNDCGRNVVDEHAGLQQLLELMRKQLGSAVDDTGRLRTVACGFLLNLVNTHAGMRLSGCSVQRPFSVQKMEPDSPTDVDKMRMITLRIKLASDVSQENIQEKAIRAGAVEILDSYLKAHSDEEATCEMALLSLGCLVDSDVGKDKLVECHIAVTVAGLLGTDVGLELQDSILELLTALAENDSVKVELAEAGLENSLLGLIKSNVDADEDESQQIVKLASDLLVLLLTGDGSMDKLYADGKSKVFEETLNWLKSSRDQLRICGSLAIGNFARNDRHCISLVESEITPLLLNVLESQHGQESNQILIHAALSALRNLAIPAGNKPIMLKQGLLPGVLRHIWADMAAVQFKLLGTIRMAIDGQRDAAVSLGTNEVFLSKLSEWCQVEEHAGVKGEASRLVACLIKHSCSEDVMKTLIRQSCIPHLVNMVCSEYDVMQNEALVALTLVGSSLLESVSSLLSNSDIVPTLKQLLQKDSTAPEIICNVLCLVNCLMASDDLKRLFVQDNYKDIIKTLKTHRDPLVQKQAKAVSTIFDKG